MEGSEIWISFRRIWISFPPDFDFVPTGFDFVPTDFEFLPRVLEVGKGRRVGPLRRCGVADNLLARGKQLTPSSHSGPSERISDDQTTPARWGRRAGRLGQDRAHGAALQAPA